MSVTTTSGKLKTAYVAGTVLDDGSGGPADPWAEDHSSLVNISDNDRTIHAVYFKGHSGSQDDDVTIEAVLASRSDFTPDDMYGAGGADEPNNERDETDSTVLSHWASNQHVDTTNGVGTGMRYNQEGYREIPSPGFRWKEGEGLHLSVEIAATASEVRYILIVYYT